MDIGEVALSGQVAWFQHLADRGCAHLRVRDGFAVSAGLPSNTDNGAVVSPAIVGRPKDLDELVGWLRQTRLPASVIVHGGTTPDGVHRLTELGLVAESTGNEMGRALTGVMDVDPRVSEVADAGGLRESYHVYRDDGWFLTEDELDDAVAVALHLGFGSGHPVRHWVAHHEGAVVGAATSFRFGDAVLLVRCCVAEPFRRRGIGTALTSARSATAMQDGAVQAVLSPSPDGFLLHRALGFALAPVPANRWFYLR